MDNIPDYYSKIKDSVRNFGLLQFGICTFHWDSSSNKFIARPFNFNVYPSSFGGVDRPFLCQPSSLTFLSCNSFDFNKWIKEGNARRLAVTHNSQEFLFYRVLTKNDFVKQLNLKPQVAPLIMAIK